MGPERNVLREEGRGAQPTFVPAGGEGGEGVGEVRVVLRLRRRRGGRAGVLSRPALSVSVDPRSAKLAPAQVVHGEVERGVDARGEVRDLDDVEHFVGHFALLALGGAGDELVEVGEEFRSLTDDEEDGHCCARGGEEKRKRRIVSEKKWSQRRLKRVDNAQLALFVLCLGDILHSFRLIPPN